MNKTALITGASLGIGLELAKVFAENGHDLVLVARNESKLTEIKSSLESTYQIQVKVIARDLSLEDSPKEIYTLLQAEDIKIDYLVNNAGFGDFGPFAGTDWPKQLDMIQLNIVALMHLTRLFLPSMLERRQGRIMNIASTGAFMPVARQSVYAATKAFVLSFTEALAEENRKSGITFTALCPGPTDTGFFVTAEIPSIPLFTIFNELAKAADVARYGYRSMMRGKTVAVCGWDNKLMVLSAQLSPRIMVRRIAASLDL